MMFYVHCKGDPDTGIPGSSAEVELTCGELPFGSEELIYVKEQIRTCFENIWDDCTTVVLTRDEMQDDET